MQKFKSKKKFNNLIIYFGIFLVSIALSIRYLYMENKINDDTIVDILVNDNFGNYKSSIKDASFIIKYALNLDLLHDSEVVEKDEIANKVEINSDKELESDEKLPIVYIYNTHQDEKYKNTYVGAHNVSSTVLLASKILKEYLKNEGIIALVEENPVTEKLHSLNWSYGKSYKISRMFMEEAKKSNPSLKYFIDLHRDSSKYDATTTKINNESYARLLFVIGLENMNYMVNLNFAEDLRGRINDYNDSLFRGIMKKSGKGVNGVYNQDFDPNTILVEVGGQYNNIKEVNNTLKIFAKILAEYIKEHENG